MPKEKEEQLTVEKRSNQSDCAGSSAPNNSVESEFLVGESWQVEHKEFRRFFW